MGDNLEIVVGCPVKDRSWILPKWKEHVDASVPQGVDLSYLFVVEPDDEDTISSVEDWADVIKSEQKYTPYSRSWGRESLERMVVLRNLLLRGVVERRPDFFLSLDSDVLLHPDALVGMMETLESNDVNDKYAACGGLTYMDPVDQRVSSFGMFAQGGFRRVSTKGRPRVVNRS